LETRPKVFHKKYVRLEKIGGKIAKLSNAFRRYVSYYVTGKKYYVK